MAEVKQQTSKGMAPAPSAPNTGSATGNRVYRQIEQAADYYEPSVYSALTFCRTMDHGRTILDEDFVPLTPSAYKLGDSKQKGLMFVVGLLPPTSNITGRLLDRSGTVGQLKGTGITYELDSARAAGTPGASGASDKNNLGPDFWEEYVKMCNRLGVDPRALGDVLTIESGFRPDPQPRNPSGAKGISQIMPYNYKALGMTDEEWKTYTDLTGTEQLYWIEKFFGGRVRGKTGAELYRQNLGGCPNPDGTWYTTPAAADAWLAANPGHSRAEFETINSLAWQAKAVAQNEGLSAGTSPNYINQQTVQAFLDSRPSGYRPVIEATMRNVGNDKGSPLLRPGGYAEGDGTTGGWATGGSKQADANRRREEKLSQVQAERERFGQDLMKAQARYVQAAQVALETMKAMPPLRMLVNPSQFSVQAEKVISDGNQSRDGFIIEHWGDGQDKIEGSGVVSGFYSADINDARSPGLGRAARTWSASFQNFLSLWLLYRNNGGIWLPEGFDTDKQLMSTYLSVLGSIYIYYDGVLYLGSFDSFDLTETDDKPHSLEYSFSFTVRAWFLLDRQDEGDFGYGAANLFKVSDAAPAVNDPAKQTAASQAAAEQRKAEAITRRDEAAKNDPTWFTQGPPTSAPTTGNARTAGGHAPKGRAGGQSGPPKAPGAAPPPAAPAKAPPPPPPSEGGFYTDADGIVRRRGGGAI